MSDSRVVSGDVVFDLDDCEACALYGGDHIMRAQWIARGCGHSDDWREAIR